MRERKKRVNLWEITCALQPNFWRRTHYSILTSIIVNISIWQIEVQKLMKILSWAHSSKATCYLKIFITWLILHALLRLWDTLHIQCPIIYRYNKIHSLQLGSGFAVCTQKKCTERLTYPSVSINFMSSRNSTQDYASEKM